MPEDDDNAGGGGEGLVRQVELDYYDNMGRNSLWIPFKNVFAIDLFSKFPHWSYGVKY